jgi:hypothetical protein
MFCIFGGFEQVIYNHRPELEIVFAITAKTDYGDLTYIVTSGKKGEVWNQIECKFEEYVWNGITISSPQQLSSLGFYESLC